MRFYICEKIGDGFTPETAYRASIVTEVGKVHCGAIELKNDLFLVGADNSIKATGKDIEITLGNVNVIATKLNIAISTVNDIPDFLQQICEKSIPLITKDHDIYVRGVKIGNRNSELVG